MFTLFTHPKQYGPKFFLLPLLFCFVSFNGTAEMQSQTALTPEMLLENAIKNGKLEDVQSLLQNGAEVNRRFHQGITPLQASVINNQEEIAAILIQAGAELNATDPATEATSLHLAALYGREGIANLLLQKGANPNAAMKFGITPLLVAVQFSQPQIVQLLLDAKKMDVNHPDQEGFTALHFAAQNGDLVIAKLLIDAGANLNLPDKTNKATPLAIAIENNHPDVIQLLREHGAT